MDTSANIDEFDDFKARAFTGGVNVNRRNSSVLDRLTLKVVQRTQSFMEHHREKSHEKEHENDDGDMKETDDKKEHGAVERRHTFCISSVNNLRRKFSHVRFTLKEKEESDEVDENAVKDDENNDVDVDDDVEDWRRDMEEEDERDLNTDLQREEELESYSQKDRGSQWKAIHSVSHMRPLSSKSAAANQPPKRSVSMHATSLTSSARVSSSELPKYATPKRSHSNPWDSRKRAASEAKKKEADYEAIDSYSNLLNNYGLSLWDRDQNASIKERDKETSTSATQKHVHVQELEHLPEHHVHYVGLVGEEGVGKASILEAFCATAHINVDELGARILSIKDDDSEKYVSILLDGEESTLEFVDLSDQELDNGVPAGENIDAYVVVYSVEDSKSFQTALDRLGEIREDEGREVAVILVANKSDLVRTRVIFEEEGKNAAKKYDCKYIEVSAAIDHKIDELLVGILKQIRLINDKYNKRRSKVSSIVHHVTGKGGDCCPMGSSQSMLGKIFGKPRMTSKSCDNLYVL